jgi:hypothetical protein
MPNRFQFSLRTLLVATACVAAVFGGISYLRELYLVQVRRIESVLAEFPEIDRVWLDTNDDVELEVEGLWFSTHDQPKAVFSIEGTGLDGASKPEIRKRLRRAILERTPTKLPEGVTYRLR